MIVDEYRIVLFIYKEAPLMTCNKKPLQTKGLFGWSYTLILISSRGFV
jgi:hypothetical protein